MHEQTTLHEETTSWHSLPAFCILFAFIIAASNRNTRSERALSVGCQHRSLHTAISELTPSIPLFQGNEISVIRILAVLFLFLFHTFLYSSYISQQSAANNYHILFQFSINIYPFLYSFWIHPSFFFFFIFLFFVYFQSVLLRSTLSTFFWFSELVISFPFG